jgi:hypothetical protein
MTALAKTTTSAPAKTKARVALEETARTAIATWAASDEPLPAVVVERVGDVEQVSFAEPYGAAGVNMFAAALGTKSDAFTHAALHRLAEGTAKPDGAADVQALNAALAFIRALRPRDEVEATLAIQAALVSAAQARAVRALAMATHWNPYSAAELAVNRLSRTFAVQLEALHKHRGGAHQRVRVEHVSLAPGAQAVFGDVHH